MVYSVKIFLLTILLVITSAFSESTSAVSIVLSSDDIENVTIRSTVLLVCVAYGNPAPTINWQYNRGSNRNSVNFSITNDTSIRHTVYNSPSFSTTLNFTESILEICGIGFEESGQYTCEARNDNGVTTNTTTVIVLERGGTTTNTMLSPSVLFPLIFVPVLSLLVFLSFLFGFICCLKLRRTQRDGGQASEPSHVYDYVDDIRLMIRNRNEIHTNSNYAYGHRFALKENSAYSRSPRLRENLAYVSGFELTQNTDFKSDLKCDGISAYERDFALQDNSAYM